MSQENEKGRKAVVDETTHSESVVGRVVAHARIYKPVLHIDTVSLHHPWYDAHRFTKTVRKFVMDRVCRSFTAFITSARKHTFFNIVNNPMASISLLL